MKKITKKFWLLGMFLSSSFIPAVAQPSVVKVDFNMSGRQLTEVNEEGYTPWAVAHPLADTLTVTPENSSNPITFIVSKGTRGANLAMTWYKAGVQSPNFARFTGDAIFVKDGDFNLGSEIDLTIKGLPAGHHTLTTYHNVTDALTPDQVCPIDIYLNGEEIFDNLISTVRVLKITDCKTAQFGIDAKAGEDVVIRFIADTLGTQAVKNVFINGFQLNGVNADNQANTPIPAHRDEHIDAAEGAGYTLQWTPAASAVSQDVYFGTDSVAVANATTSSPEYKGHQSADNNQYVVSDLHNLLTYYWRVDEVSASQTYKGQIWEFRTRHLAFPGAEGYGRFARGGRGGKVVEVTNLNDDGPGSLREAVTNDIGPRTIVFKVSGMIQLQSRLVLSQPYVTVAGQTAPGKGICIRSAPFGFTGNDVIGRFLRVRIGAGITYDGMGLTGANNSILDHSSISWTIDESFSSRGAHNITLQRTLISEALNDAGHQNYPAGTEHGYAATIGGDIGSFHHNLLADCYGRNWSIGGGLDGNGFYSGRLDITNNVVYNWGSRATDGGGMEVNFINNYYKPGAGTTFFYAYNAQHEGVGKGMQRCYFAGNVMPGHFNEANEAAGRKASYSNGDTSSYETFVSNPFFPSYVTQQTAYDGYKDVMSDIGCSMPALDDHDKRIIQETLDSTYSVVGSLTGKKGFPDNEADAGGFEDYPETVRPDSWDSDHDGLPDWWETAKGLNPHSATGDFSDSNGDPDGDGYTNLEDYLNWLAMPHYESNELAPIEVNLKQLTKGYTKSPVYTISKISNGTVTMKNDSIAAFTFSSNSTIPMSNAVTATDNTKMGSFDFTVQDAEGSAMTRSVNVLYSPASATPVQFVDFQAKRTDNHTVSLNWETKQEINCKNFEIQKSSNGKDFISTGNVVTSKSVNGNSAAPLTYQTTDLNTETSVTYYRIVQNDLDGKSQYSSIQQVQGATGSAVNIWPVPSSGQINIQTDKSLSQAQVLVYTLLGKCIMHEAIESGKVLQFTIPAKGVYLVKVVNNDNVKLYEGKVIIK